MKNFFIVAKLLFFSFAFSQISHTIMKGDTPYNISKKYGITINELYKENPQLKDGFKIGEIINIKDNTKKNIPIETKIGRIVLQEKQTLYSITKQFRITEEELRRLNPNLKIAVGKEISLPLENINKYKDAKTILATSVPYLVEKNTPTNTKTAEQQYVLHKVTSDDTTFGIIHKYGINIDELTELNPQLSNGLKVGSTLKIRKYDAIYTKTNGNALNVALMLPFGFDSNDEKYRNMATDFLSGALLAIERNTRNGLQLDVKIIDSGNEQSFKKSLSQINQKNTDLIFGPFFKSNIIDVLDFLGNKKIPVVAPFANSEDLYNYPNLIVMETADIVFANRIAKEVEESYNNEKIFIVSGNNKSISQALKNNLSKSLKNANINIVNTADEIQLDKNMMTGKPAPVITILASNNDNDGTLFTNKVIELANEVNGIKAFSLYHTNSFDKKSEALYKVNLIYLIDRKINIEGTFEQEIMAQYKEKYCKNISKYAVIGFDIVNDILSRENTKGEVFKNINRSQTQLATKFEFVKAKAGGAYINIGYRVIRLIP